MKIGVISSAVLVLAVSMIGLAQSPTTEPPSDPIAYIGHGAIFDSSGKEINVTPQFIEEAQKYYLDALYQKAPPNIRSQTDEKMRALSGIPLGEQGKLIVNSLLIDFLIDLVKPENAGDLSAKNNILRRYLRTKISPINQPFSIRNRENFKPPSNLLRVIQQEDLAEEDLPQPAADRINYINQCAAAGVPIPPDWGDSKWINKGILADEFISDDLEAEVFTYDSTSPEGLCIALPRSIDTEIQLLGIICLGKMSSKACFWDNQENDKGYPITKGEIIKLTKFAGGPELDGGSGGTCTSCHAGENPFIIHPKTALGLPNLRGLELRPDSWYIPMVHPSWPQNAGPTDLLDTVESISSCIDCHTEFGSGGRFPELSPKVAGYCGAVMENAINRTMPPGNAGDPDYEGHTIALRAACGLP